MNPRSRREFFGQMSGGMLVATLGPALAAEFGFAPRFVQDPGDRLHFGELEPLVALLQESPLEKLQPALVDKLRAGTELGALVAAAALANARTFGGEDYIGFHCEMALMPAYAMATKMPGKLQPLPVLKVLYRNTQRIHDFGGPRKEVLHRVEPGERSADRSGDRLRACLRDADKQGAERAFAAQTDPEAAFGDVLQLVQDDPADIHRIALAWRAWDTLRLVGMQHANTMLRQSVRYCVDWEQDRVRRGVAEPEFRSLLPRLLEEHRLLESEPAPRKADDAWIEALSRTIFGSSRAQAAAAVAAALAEGFAPEDLGEAMSLAANRLLRNDPGVKKNPTAEKPLGSVHGATVGLHASDAANAWRHVARFGERRNRVACLIAGAYHTAGQSHLVGAEPFHPAIGQDAATKDPAALLRETEARIREQDQAGASGLVERYGKLGHDAAPMFDLLLKYGVGADGALHAEKYFLTVAEEFAAARPRFRWNHLVGLARVTVSEQTIPAPGLAQARELLA
ncbi:MAG TPA: hypothetical protein VGC54_03270 [Planctomycetota bacterium]